MERYINNKIDQFTEFIKEKLNEKDDAIWKWRDMYNDKDAEFENYKNNVERRQADKCRTCNNCSNRGYL